MQYLYRFLLFLIHFFIQLYQALVQLPTWLNSFTNQSRNCSLFPSAQSILDYQSANAKYCKLPTHIAFVVNSEEITAQSINTVITALLVSSIELGITEITLFDYHGKLQQNQLKSLLIHSLHTAKASLAQAKQPSKLAEQLVLIRSHTKSALSVGLDSANSTILLANEGIKVLSKNSRNNAKKSHQSTHDIIKKFPFNAAHSIKAECCDFPSNWDCFKPSSILRKSEEEGQTEPPNSENRSNNDSADSTEIPILINLLSHANCNAEVIQSIKSLAKINNTNNNININNNSSSSRKNSTNNSQQVTDSNSFAFARLQESQSVRLFTQQHSQQIFPISEPLLLLCFNSSNSFLGFPSWLLRVCEVEMIPRALSSFNLLQFYTVLQHYNNSIQREGT
jgi:hypothetical protein